MTFVCSLSLLLLATAGCSLLPVVRSEPDRVTLAAPSVRVPLIEQDHRYLAPLTVNDQQVQPFLFDTGSTVLVLAEQTAESLNVDTSARPFLVHGATQSEWDSIGTAHVDRVALAGRDADAPDARNTAGSVVLEDMTAWVLPRSPGEGGIFGLTVFPELLVTVDLGHRTFLLEPGALPPGDGAEVFDYELSRGIPRVAATVADKPLKLEIDTGFNLWLSVSASLETALEFEPRAPIPIEMRTIHGTTDREMRRLAGSLWIGTHEIRRPWVVIGDAGARIGTRLLRHFQLTFDQTNRRVRFVRHDGEQDPIEVAEIAASRLGRGISPPAHVR